MSSAETMRSGLPTDRACSQGCSKPGMRRCETEKPVRPALGLAPRPGRAFVADLAAGAGRRAGKRRDRGRMVVRLDLHRGCRWARRSRRRRRSRDSGSSACRARLPITAALSRYAESTPCGCFACVLRIIANSDFGCALAVDDPVGVEDLVPAVLGVRLREHHELDVGGIALAAPRSSSPGSRSRRRTARARARCWPLPAHRVRCASDTVRSGRGRFAREQSCGVGGARAAPSRSCDRTAARRARAALRATAAPAAFERVQTMPRSMRRTASRPHTCAMSVALLDQGEMVPKRGTTDDLRALHATARRAILARTVGQQAFEQRAFARRRGRARHRRNG